MSTSGAFRKERILSSEILATNTSRITSGMTPKDAISYRARSVSLYYSVWHRSPFTRPKTVIATKAVAASKTPPMTFVYVKKIARIAIKGTWSAMMLKLVPI